MSANSVYCHILGSEVTIVADLNGEVKNVICPRFMRLTHSCAIKLEEAGVVGTFIRKIADRSLGTKSIYCEFAEPRLK